MVRTAVAALRVAAKSKIAMVKELPAPARIRTSMINVAIGDPTVLQY
jgi:hypothetical protein